MQARENTKTKKIYLSDSIIYSPKSEYEYHLQNKWDLPETIVTFNNESDKCQYVDVSVGLICFDLERMIYMNNCDYIFLSNESLPWKSKIASSLPLLWWHPEKKLTYITRLDIRLTANDEVTCSVKMASPPIKLYHLISQPIYLKNARLKKECQKQVEKVPVIIGNYPIIFAKENPSADFLHQLYANFIAYNTDAKLNYQRKNSENLCHIRAHFVGELLNHYQIRSVKLFKRWNSIDWKKFDYKNILDFHSAMMIIDNENNKWVWDPWIGLNHQLLSLNQWLIRKDEPKPANILMMNRHVIDSSTEGSRVECSRLSQLFKSDHDAFQAVLMDAIPNPPTASLVSAVHGGLSCAMNRNSFFHVLEPLEKKFSQHEKSVQKKIKIYK